MDELTYAYVSYPGTDLYTVIASAFLLILEHGTGVGG